MTFDLVVFHLVDSPGGILSLQSDWKLLLCPMAAILVMTVRQRAKAATNITPHYPVLRSTPYHTIPDAGSSLHSLADIAPAAY